MKLSIRDLPLFVYGTMRKTQPNHWRLGSSTYLGIAHVCGTLVILDNSPVLLPNSENFVKGELYQVPHSLFPSIDNYEAPYVRKIVPAKEGFPVQIYLDPDEII